MNDFTFSLVKPLRIFILVRQRSNNKRPKGFCYPVSELLVSFVCSPTVSPWHIRRKKNNGWGEVHLSSVEIWWSPTSCSKKQMFRKNNSIQSTDAEHYSTPTREGTTLSPQIELSARSAKDECANSNCSEEELEMKGKKINWCLSLAIKIFKDNYWQSSWQDLH